MKAIPQTSTSRKQNALSDQLNQFICNCQDPQQIEQTVICASLFCVIHEFHKSCTESKRFSKSWLCTFCKNKCFKDKEKRTSNKLDCANAMELVEPCSVGDLVVAVVDNCESMNPVEVVERTDIT